MTAEPGASKGTEVGQQTAEEVPAPDDALRDRIGRYSFDRGNAAVSFTERLALSNGWDPAFAERVVGEYRRFIYLIRLSQKQLTPSDEVDQAWMLHIGDSRQYWDEFCPEVLEQPLHRQPLSTGDEALDAERYEEGYSRTLRLYRAMFNEVPPPDIWPPSQVRFGSHFVRLNRSIFDVVPYRSYAVGRVPYFPSGLTVIVLAAFYFVWISNRAAGLSTRLLESITAAVIGVCLIAVAKWGINLFLQTRPSAQSFSQKQHGYLVKITPFAEGRRPLIRVYPRPVSLSASSGGATSHGSATMGFGIGTGTGGAGGGQ